MLDSAMGLSGAHAMTTAGADGSPGRYEPVESFSVRGPDGREYEVAEAIALLPWVSQLCPLMPHDYAASFKSPEWAWRVVDAMTSARNPETYRAYFRGYPRANRYWDAPDGLRYWRTRELNRCSPDSVEPLRLVAEGAKAIDGWDGPPWAPNGIGLYERRPGRKGWWPTKAAIDAGYRPCKACLRGSPTS